MEQHLTAQTDPTRHRACLGARIALGLSQRDFAENIGTNESQVSRDERHEYYGVTVERAARIFDAVGVEITTRVEKVPAMAKSA